MTKQKPDYIRREVLTIVELSYPDGEILYDLQGEDESGTWSSGLFNELDLIIEILRYVGKIGKDTKVYCSPNRRIVKKKND